MYHQLGPIDLPLLGKVGTVGLLPVLLGMPLYLSRLFFKLDVLGLFHCGRQVVVVTHHPVAEELLPLFVSRFPWPDSLVTSCMSVTKC